MYQNKICVICEKKFSPYSGTQVSCSEACKKKDRKIKAQKSYDLIKPKIEIIEKKCLRCGKTFLNRTGRTGNPNKKFCSLKCTRRETSKRFRLKDKPGINPDYKFNCKVCGKIFQAKKSNQKYCSEKCSNLMWSRNNKDKLKDYRDKFYSKEENRKKTLEYQKIYRKTEKGKLTREKNLKKYKSDGSASRYRKNQYEKTKKNPEKYALLKIYTNCRKRVREAVKTHDVIKSDKKIIELFGCTSLKLKKHLEKQFEPEMSWDNYGSYWEVDHIIPLSHFDVKIRSERNRANHYSNLQPMEAEENRKKGNKIL